MKQSTYRRILALLLCLVLAVTPVLTGCGAMELLEDEDVQNAASELISAALSDDEDTAQTDSDTTETDAEPEDAEPAAAEQEESAEETAEAEQTSETADTASEEAPAEEEAAEEEALPDIDGTYTSKEDVALYIHVYGKLPGNFITKKQAEALGWSGGGLEAYAPGKCIGGSRFGNYEGILPEKEGRTYTECDIDTLGASSRGAKRIVFSNDGLIYYTEDHYETFELLYGEE